MSISKKPVFNNYKDVFSSAIQEYFLLILEKFVPTKKKILLFIQCSKIKPYSNSISHKYIRKAIEDAIGYDPYLFPENCQIQIVVISSLIGPVPYEFDIDYIPSHYNLSVNKITKNQFEEIKPILVERISKFLLKFKDYYEKIIFFVKNNYKIVCEECIERTKLKSTILPKKKLHMTREAWIELKSTISKLI